MNKVVRDPHYFGNHEANATIRYVEVYEISPDPGESDDFPIPYQPVQVKKLRFEGYVAAAVAIETANADITVRTRRSGKKHGTRGNGIDVAFDIDSGITPTAEAAFDEPTDVLTIKVKTSGTTWLDVAAAVATVLDGAFVLEASNTAATVGAAIESETGTLSGGVDGAYETYGNAFGIGDHDTKDDATVGAKFWIIWRADPKRWEILTGGGAGGTSLREARVTEDIPGRVRNDDGDGWDTVSTGKAILVDPVTGYDIGTVGDDDFSVTNRDDQFYGINYRVWLDGLRVDHGSCWPIEWPQPPE